MMLRFLPFLRALTSKFIVFENRQFQVICTNDVSSPEWLCKMPVLAACIDLDLCDVMCESDHLAP